MSDRAILVYLAAPVGAPDAAGVRANLIIAAQWLAWLKRRDPVTSYVCPWLGPLIAGIEDDCDPAQRARGLRDCCEAARRCDGIVLVGGRISTGMQMELDAVCRDGGWVADLTELGQLPPADYDDQYRDFNDEPSLPLDVGMRLWEAP